MTICRFVPARSAAAALTAVGLSLGIGVSGAAAAVTTSDVTTPTNGKLMMHNVDANPNQTMPVAGSSDGTTGDKVDIRCYLNGEPAGNAGGVAVGGIAGGSPGIFQGADGTGIAVNADGTFSADVPLSDFDGHSCELLAVPHSDTDTFPPQGTSFTGPRIGISSFTTFRLTSGPNAGDAFDYSFADAALGAGSGADSLDNCGPFVGLVDPTPPMQAEAGPQLLDCGGQFYDTPANFLLGPASNPGRSEIVVDGQTAYGSYSAMAVNPDLPGFPVLNARVDAFDPSNGDAQTSDSESLVKCTPNNVYGPSATDCTAYAPTGVSVTRVSQFTNQGRVQTVTDTFTSDDGAAHTVNLLYEDDLNSLTAAWELPGDSTFTPRSTGDIGAAVATAPGTAFVAADPSQAPSLNNPVAALTFSVPYSSVQFNNNLWPNLEETALFNFERAVPAGGSTSVTWSYATGSSTAEVAAEAATARADLTPPAAPSAPPPPVAPSAPPPPTPPATPVKPEAVAAAAPSALIFPGRGQTFALGRRVTTRFSCSEGTGGPGISSCVDSNGAGGGVGQLQTGAVGAHTYSVTAVSKDSQRGTASISYNVVKASIGTGRASYRAALTQIRVVCDGPPGGVCNGRLTLTARMPVKRAKAVKTVTLGTTHFALRAGHSPMLTVVLQHASGTIRATATARVQGTITAQRKLTLVPQRTTKKRAR